MTGGFTVRALYEWDTKKFTDSFIAPVDKSGNLFMDKDIYIQNILLELGDLPLCYPNFDYMYISMSAWSKSSAYEWTKFVELLKTEYQPLENYNRNEDITNTTEYNSTISKNYIDSGRIETSRDLTNAKSGNDISSTEYNTNLKDTGTVKSNTDMTKTSEQNGNITRNNTEKLNVGNTQTTTQTVTPNSLTSTTNVSAFNDNVLRPRESVVQSGSQKTDTTVVTVYDDTSGNGNVRDEKETYNNLKTATKDSGSITDTHDMSHTHTGYEKNTFTHGETLKDSGDITETRDLNNSGSDIHTGTDKVTIKNNTSGNIGVMSSQQMWIQEYELLPRMNIVDYVTESFKQKFCLMIY